jgi:hypothetical protein
MSASSDMLPKTKPNENCGFYMKLNRNWWGRTVATLFIPSIFKEVPPVDLVTVGKLVCSFAMVA